MNVSNDFHFGDQVRISAQYWDSELAGRRGIVAPAPPGVQLQNGCLWLELEVDKWIPGVIDGAEVSKEDLQHE